MPLLPPCSACSAVGSLSLAAFMSAAQLRASHAAPAPTPCRAPYIAALVSDGLLLSDSQLRIGACMCLYWQLLQG